ncbi:hypothetical protein PsYK624_003010 [Phanerochaete sordida]|uniref:BTB domain-containing protein n=1 Tax=Phanerochaete sordida TaxID=48140 RepID=A0A9P3FXV0_9APHY|nr:hypothetical protein PsYK624_003010 [Phanerochaete sordida]
MSTHRSGSIRSTKQKSPERSATVKSKSHRPSLSGPMNWLGRSSSSASTSSGPYAPSKPMRISEPQLQSAFDSMGKRSGTLGAGAVVVRTPQEALAGPRHADDVDNRSILESEIESAEDDVEELSIYSPSRPNSPPLPPIPDDDELEYTESEHTPSASTPPRPTRPAPPPPMTREDSDSSGPSTPNLRPNLKVLDSFPPVPALPANIPASPPQAPFEPILLSSPPASNVDPAKVIVSLETSTTTHKTTMQTLMSRPSQLASYLQSLIPPPDSAVEPETPVSRSSETDGSFSAIFHRHLASTGLLLPSSTTLHIFLDRPSAPYAHILAYLRTPVSTPEHPAALPRGVQLLSASSARLEALLELRDEAWHVGLDELYRLCTDELRCRQSLGSARASLHARVMSSSSTGSVRSLGLAALREATADEQVQVEEVPRRKQQHRYRRSGDSGIASGSASSHSPRASVVPEVGWHSPAASSSTSSIPGLAQRNRSPHKYVSLRTKPNVEWI